MFLVLVLMGLGKGLSRLLQGGLTRPHRPTKGSALRVGQRVIERSLQTNEVQARRRFDEGLLRVRESSDPRQASADGQGVRDLRGFRWGAFTLLHEPFGLGKG